MKHVIVLPDGVEISSGAGTVNAIKSTSYSASVNSGTELTAGAVCAASFDVSIISPGGEMQIQEGTELVVFSEDETGTRTQVGLFTTQKPTRTSANMYRVQAYDRAVWLDRDISTFIDNLTAWPYTLYDLAVLALRECNLALINSTIPNGSHAVQKFVATGMTGRMLMQRICEACCRFGRITPGGDFEFAWYKEAGKVIEPKDIARNSLAYEDYETHEIETVRIQQTEDDVGVSYPAATDGANTYAVTGNFLLTATTEDDLLPVAQTIYDEIRGITYTPCKFSTWYPSGLTAGDIVYVRDRNGKLFRTCIMNISRAGGKENVQSTGNYRRDSSAAVNQEIINSAIFGKLLEVRKNIEGLRIAAKDLESKVSTELNLVANGLDLVITQVEGIQTYYRFDADGQYIGRTDDEAILRLAAGVIDVLVAGYAAATFDRTGLTAPQATVETLNVGEYTLFVDSDGCLNCS
jgi:hypothetical protein